MHVIKRETDSLIRRETDAEKLSRIEAQLAQVSGLDFREHAHFHRAIDIIFITGRPHWNGSSWDHVMITHFSRHDVGVGEKPWSPLVKIAFGLTSPPLTNSQSNRIGYVADMLNATFQFSMIAPRLIQQPTHLLNELGKRNGKGKAAMDRCVDALDAYHRQSPVSRGQSNEVVPVPDPRKFPPPPMPSTGTAEEAHNMVADLSSRFAVEDANLGSNPKREDFKPHPPDGFRWSPEFLEAWAEGDFSRRYHRVFFSSRGTIDGRVRGVVWAKEDHREGAPKRTIEFSGFSPHPSYVPAWTQACFEAYNEWLDERRGTGPTIGGPTGPIDGPTPSPGPGRPADPTGGPASSPGRRHDPIGGPTLGPTDPTGDAELHQALAKTIAYKKCGKHTDKKLWAERLVELLENGGHFTD